MNPTTSGPSDPGAALPADYYASLAAVEAAHWWHRGMRAISEALLGDRLRPDETVLDAGCGTGGLLAWLASLGVTQLAGIDPSAEAVERARRLVPTADIRVAALASVPFPDAAFGVVTCNDVLQHVDERDIARSLEELRRVLRPDGALLVRTNGGRRARRERPDWRLYDRSTLVGDLERSGFRCLRASSVNVLGSVAESLRGRGPTAPTGTSHGIPRPPTHGGRPLAALLRLEGELVRRGARLPFGHTLVALAVPASPSTTRSPVSADR